MANVDGLLRSMTWEQFLEWRTYEVMEPFGDRRADWHAASICAAIWNSTLAVRGINKDFRPKDFLLTFTTNDTPKTQDTPTPARDWRAMKFIARMWTSVMNAEERNKK